MYFKWVEHTVFDISMCFSFLWILPNYRVCGWLTFYLFVFYSLRSFSVNWKDYCRVKLLTLRKIITELFFSSMKSIRVAKRKYSSFSVCSDLSSNTYVLWYELLLLIYSLFQREAWSVLVTLIIFVRHSCVPWLQYVWSPADAPNQVRWTSVLIIADPCLVHV